MHLTREVKLQDSGNLIQSAVGASYNHETRNVTFCDIKSNRIARYSTDEGAEVLVINPSDSLTFRFHGDDVEEKEWIDFLSNYPAPATFSSILRPSTGDTIVAIAKIVSGNNRVVRSDGDSSVVWKSDQCLVTFVNGHSIDVLPLPKSEWYPFGTFYRGTNGSLIVQGLILPSSRDAGDVNGRTPQFWYVHPKYDTISQIDHPTKLHTTADGKAIRSSILWSQNGDLGKIYIIKNCTVDVWNSRTNSDTNIGVDGSKFYRERSFEYCDSTMNRVVADALWLDDRLNLISPDAPSAGLRRSLFLTRLSDLGAIVSDVKLELPKYRIGSPSLLWVDEKQIIVLAQSEVGPWKILFYYR